MRKQPAKATAKQREALRLTTVNRNAIIAARSLNRLIDDYFGSSAVKKIVAYFRVSTGKQAASGLGLEGQQAAVDAFRTTRG